MKFIITENRLEKLKKKIEPLVNSFIDEYVAGFNRKTLGGFIIYTDPNINDDYYDSIRIEYDFSDGRLYIEHELIQVVSDTFGFEPLDVQILFAKWFIKKDGIVPEYVETPRIGIYNN